VAAGAAEGEPARRRRALCHSPTACRLAAGTIEWMVQRIDR